MVLEKQNEEKDEVSEKKYSERQMVVFTLGNEEFGVDINEVNSIIKMAPITRIPNSQDYIEGVINLRGRIIVVVDLAKKLGLPIKERDKDTRIIVIETNDTMVGMIVDHSREAIRISEDQIEPAPSLIAQKINSDYLEGVGIVGERLLILLDLSKVLSTGDMASVQKAQVQASSMPSSEKQEKKEESNEENSPETNKNEGIDGNQQDQETNPEEQGNEHHQENKEH